MVIFIFDYELQLGVDRQGVWDSGMDERDEMLCVIYDEIDILLMG